MPFWRRTPRPSQPEPFREWTPYCDRLILSGSFADDEETRQTREQRTDLDVSWVPGYAAYHGDDGAVTR